MPLNEREQRILEEIERQFYEEDPKLAQTVARTTLSSLHRRKQRLAGVAFILGLVVMLGFFTRSSFVAVAGFIVMLVSAGWITMNMRRSQREGERKAALESWVDRLRQRWRRDR